MNRLVIDVVSRYLMDICDSENAFGGMMVVIGGILDIYFPWSHIEVANLLLWLHFVACHFGMNVVLCSCV